MTTLQRYAAGEISARQAAKALGPKATEHDVFAGVVAAHLSLPQPTPEELAQQVQDSIIAHRRDVRIPMVVGAKRYPLGFFLAFSRKVIDQELPGGRLIPGTPYYIILHQEEFLLTKFSMGVGELLVTPQVFFLDAGRFLVVV